MTNKPKTGILTFLFTDLEKSTHLWENYPEKMQLALARHDTLLKTAVEKHNGKIVKSTGDGLHAVFESPADGIAAALAAQLAITAEDWPEEIGQLKVRMGLHSGESEERDGDYFGPVLNRAARIMAVAHGGQIVLSHTTATLIEDALPPDTTLVDLGEHQLKDLSRAENLYQLNHPDLPSDFPPLNSLSKFKHNLPLQLTSFIGREKELAKIRQIIAPPPENQYQNRLLTLLGPGGTGKTRLALQTAADLVGKFPDGVWFIELAPLTDPDLVPERVASTLNVPEQPGRNILDTLTGYLRSKELLLIFDNVEHLVRECAELVEHLLLHCPSIKILVTGREALFIDGETTIQVPSLSIPKDSSLPADILAASEAVQLFTARAQAVRQDFRITPENASIVIEIVRRLDGIPLALELAAARLRMMSVEQISERLNDRFRLLTGGRRTALPRQQTLQALIDWSWNLLDEKEQTLLCRLSVFTRGWTLEAAQAVAGAGQLNEFDVIDLLEQLINKSLVNVEYLPKGDVRYAMLESIRQYARDRLFDAGEGESLRERHAEFFTAFSQQMSKNFEGQDMLFWLERYLLDLDNTKAAMDWSLESRLDLALKMTDISMLVQRYVLATKDRKQWLEELVRKTRVHPAVETDPEYQRGLANAVISLGSATFAMGEGDKARPILEEGISLARAAKSIERMLLGLNLLLIILLQRGKTEEAKVVAEEAIAVSKENDFKFLYMMAIGSFTPIFVFQGDHQQAKANTEEAIRLAKELKNPWTMAIADMLNGYLERSNNNWKEAEIAFYKSHELFKAIRDTRFAMINLSEAGHMKRLQGDYHGAEHVYRRTIQYFNEAVGRSPIIHQLECFGIVAAYQNQYERGAKLLGAAQTHREAEQSLRLPNEQVEFEQAAEYLAGAMGEEARNAAFNQGRKMSIDEAVQLALEK